MYLKSIFLCISLILSQAGFAQKNTFINPSFTLSGHLKKAENKKIYLSEQSSFSDNVKTDSIKADRNGKFVFSGIVKEPTYFILKTALNNQMIGFYIENVPMTLQGSADSLSSVRITGSIEETIRQKFDQVSFGFDYGAIAKEFKHAASRSDTSAMRKAKINEALLIKEEQLAIRKLMIQYPLSAASVNQVNGYLSSHKEQDLLTADSLLLIYEKSAIASYPQVKLLRKQYEVSRKLIIGKNAPDFQQADTSGHTLKLSDFRGQYLLVDFWASWCGPCRTDNPNLVRAHKAFHDKNFQILSVSLDFRRDKWIKAIKDDHLEWKHVSDLKYWRNQIAIEYSINMIPFNFLLNPEGKIIALNLKGDELYNLLSSIIK